MTWDELIEDNRQWVERHQISIYQKEAAHRMTALCDAMEQLLSDETVERVARAMHRHDVNEGIVVAAWGSSLGQDDDYRRAARAALNAAVGES